MGPMPKPREFIFVAVIASNHFFITVKYKIYLHSAFSLILTVNHSEIASRQSRKCEGYFRVLKQVRGYIPHM